MYRSVLSAGFVALVLGGAVPAAAQQADTPPVSFTDTVPAARLAALVEEGAVLFHGGSCVFCHGVGARGDGFRGPNLTDEEWLHSEGDFEGISETLRWGVKRSEIKAMTPRPFQMNPGGGMSLTFPQSLALSAYVWSRQGGLAPGVVSRQEEVLARLDAGDTNRAIELLHEDARARPDSVMFPERAINALGYQFMQRRGLPRIALPLFAFNTEMYPDSWNTWDSLGEAYATLGETSEAIEAYEKSLELNPRNQGGAEALERLRSP